MKRRLGVVSTLGITTKVDSLQEVPGMNDAMFSRESRRNAERLFRRLGKEIYMDRNLRIGQIGTATSPSEVIVAVGRVNMTIASGDSEEAILGLHRNADSRVCITLADLSISCMSRAGQYDRIERVVNARVAELGNPRVIMMGISAGGHGALHLAKRLNAARAIGFSPLCSTDDKLFKEERWQKQRRRLATMNPATVGDEMSPDCRYTAIYAADQPEDQRHYAYLSRNPQIETILLREGGHTFTRRLRDLGLLEELCEALYADRPLPQGMEAELADAETVAAARTALDGELPGDRTAAA